MSANIPNPAPRSRIKVAGGYRNPSPEKKNFKSKSRRSKTPERSLAPLPVFQFSSTDSASEMMVTSNSHSNKTFYENNRPPRGRENTVEKSRRSRSRERYLEESLSAQELPVPPLDLPSNSSDFGEDATTLYPQNQWEFQREIGHVRSSTHPSSTRQHQAKFKDENTNYENTNELMELRMRNEQMEKTLRWWSDCTANWREKWTKVRAERNRAREELKQTRGELEEAAKELKVLRQQRGLLVQENKVLRQNEANGKDESASEENTFSSSGIHKGSDVLPSATKPLKGSAQGKNSSGGRMGADKVDEDHLSQKNAALQLKIDESAKTVQAERDAKLSLNKTIEKQDQEMSTLKQKYNELKDAKQDILKQLTRLQASHRSEVVRINQSLEEELQNRSQIEKKIHDLREEIEHLQEENTSEWGKRERLETEKLQLERDNKRLKSVAEEMRTSLEKRRKSVAEDKDNELMKSQTQVHDLKETLNDLQRQASRDQKLLDEKQEELLHSRRRGEQHENEVRQLRNRVEEIKKHQAATEDELDNAQNQSRKLLRVVEEKEEEIEKLQIQFDQIQTRIRREPTSSAWNKTSPYKRDMENALSSDSSCEI